MKCPHCGAATDVKDTRMTKPNEVTRRRECFNGHKFKTLERHDDTEGKKTYERGGRVGLRGMQEDGV
jgi:transcriptional regulator NrdR family protein